MKIRLIMLCLLGSVTPFAQAKERSLQELWQAAKQHHPSLRAAESRHTAAQAERRQASVWDNPELALEGENIGGDRSGIDEAEWTLSLEQSIAWPGRRARKKQGARLHADQISLEQRATVRKLSMHLAREVYETMALQEQVLSALEAVEQAEAFVLMAQRRVEAGISSILEVNKAKLALSTRSLELQRLENEALNAIQRLSRMVGQPLQLVTGDLREAPPPPTREAVSAALRNTPDFLGLDAEVVQRELELIEAKQSWVPDLTLAGGVRQNDAEELQSFLGTVGITLPLWNRGAAEKTAARARLKQAESERALAVMAFNEKVTELSSSLHLLWQEQLRYRDELLPLITQHAKQAAKSYREGFIGYLEYLDARNELRAQQNAYIEILTDYQTTYQQFRSLADIDAEQEKNHDQ